MRAVGDIRHLCWMAAAAALTLGVALSMGAPATAAAQVTYEDLGSVTMTVATSTAGAGFGSGYGTLVSGEFPAGLFDDDTARSVAAIYESSDGNWHLKYSGGTAQDWLSGTAALAVITVVAVYGDGVDTRSFVLGGYIVGEEGQRGLELDPPVPGLDWDDRAGENVTIEFRRVTGQTSSVATTTQSLPDAEPGSFVEFLQLTVPGGPVTFQALVTIMVYAMFLYRTPRTPSGVLMAAIVLILTPWGPVLIGYGDPIGSALVFVNVVAGAYAYRAFAAHTVT